MSRRVVALLAFLAVAGVGHRVVSAEGLGAIVAENGVSLKVVTTKDTKVYSEPKEDARGEGVPAFSIFYVLPPARETEERRLEKVGEPNLAKDGFLRVAAGPQENEAKGWLKKADTIYWAHREALGFTPLGSRERALFFATKPEAEAVFTNPAATSSALFREPANLGNVRMMMPLIDSTNLPPRGGHDIHLYELAIMAAKPAADVAPPPTTSSGEVLTPEFVKKNATADIVFVIDTTGSMGPPIEQVKASIRKTIERLRSDERLRNILRLGLVAYRDPTAPAEKDATDGYVTRTFCTLAEGKDMDRFLKRLDELVPGGGGDLAEDVLAGLTDAMDPAMGWNDVAFKQIVLVGDASAREASHPTEGAQSNRDSNTVADVMRAAQPDAAVGSPSALMKVFQISTIHIYNPDPGYAEDNAVAENQFRTLAREARLFKGAFVSKKGGESPEDFSGELTTHLVSTAKDLFEYIKEGKPPPAAAPGSVPSPGGTPPPGGAGRSSTPYPVLELLRALPGGGDESVPTFQRTFATEFDAMGNQVLVVHVLIVRDELDSFVNILKFLVSQLRKAMGSEKNVTRVVESLKRVSAEVTTADTFSEDTNLDTIFQGILKVPLKTPIFTKSIRAIMGLSDSSFREWLRQAEECQDQLERILKQEDGWFALYATAHKSQQHRFVSLGDLP